jgi:hypothetical protein
MAFTDAIFTKVNWRHAPGGHWIAAYPFVRVQQPSAFCGVSSVPLGRGTVDATGLNAGFHETASADELRAYYAQVMDQHFLTTRCPEGAVRGRQQLAGTTLSRPRQEADRQVFRDPQPKSDYVGLNVDLDPAKLLTVKSTRSMALRPSPVDCHSPP